MRSSPSETARGEHQLLASIVDSSQDAVIGETLDGKVTTWNRAAEEIFGYSASEMIGQPIIVLFPTELEFEDELILDQVRRGERIHPYDTVRVAKGGRRVDVSLGVSPIYDGSGAVVGASKIARDITEQKALGVRLAEVQSALAHVSRLSDMGLLAAAFAHELNQPLSAISAYVGGTRRLIEAGDLDRAVEGCDRAVAQVARAGEVIRRLRDFVRKGDDRRSAEDLGQVIAESAALLQLGARRDGVTTDIRVADDARVAFIDKVQIQQVLVNLLRNAAEAMSGAERRKLVVTTRLLDSQRIEVEVADNGPGLPQFVLDRLFQPFTTNKPTGMGVGLSLCRNIVESQGGQISAENAASGGAVFRFTLPTS